MSSEPNGLTAGQLAEVLRRTGLTNGDSVIIHSSLRSLGRVTGGPGAVIQALLDVVGPTGNLMFPTFNYWLSPTESYFDPAQTPGKTGAITEAARKWPGARRSLHPSHSVTVIGPDAKALTDDHLKCRTVGIGSPADRLAKRGGKVLLVGVGHIANTMIHIGEEYAGVPKAPWAIGLPVVKVLMPDGRATTCQLDTSTSCSAAFGAVEYKLRQKGLIQDLRLGSAALQLMRGAEVIDCVCEMVKDKPDILLCTNPECKPCVGARQNICRGVSH